MGDTNEGSSLAAQRARSLDGDSHQADHKEEEPPEAADAQPGFFGRIVQAFSPQDSPEPTEVNGHIAAALIAVPGVGNLRRMRVEDVLIPRAEIMAVPDTITKDDLVDVFRDSGLTRLPVYSGTLDTPLGFAHLKDLALKHGFNGKSGRFLLKKLIRPLLFVPPSMPLGVLLTKMQTDRVHMALVIDEYGGVDGLVTIEDLIEQVIGEIEDEHDIAEGRFWTEEKPGCYLAEARAPLQEFQSEIGLDLTSDEEIDEEEIDTLGGLVFMLSGRVPARGEVVPHPAGPEFEVVDADPRRIKRLRVYVPNQAEDRS